MSVQYLALAAAVVVLLLAASIHIVMPHLLLMSVRVVASEMTPWLIAAALLAGAVGIAARTPGWQTPATLVAALAAIVLAAVPLTRVPSVIAAVRSELPGPARDASRTEPFSLLDTFRGLGVRSVPVARDIVFREIARDTLRLDRYGATEPGAARPAIVVVHGGSWRGGNKGSGAVDTPTWSRAFASRGFVVYDIQYRLAPAAHFPDPVDDVLCALAYVRANAPRDGVDPERVVLLGRSAGAHLALVAAYTASRARPDCGRPARIAAVVALYGPVDLLAAYADPGDPDLIDGRSVLRDFLGGTPDEVNERYKAATPLLLIDEATPPTLLIHGDNDQVVYPLHSERLTNALREAGRRVVFLRLPWSGHGFDAIARGIGGQIALWTTERFIEEVVARPR